MKTAAEEATDVLESTYSTASKGASEYGLKVIEAARTNTNAAFDFAGELMARRRSRKWSSCRPRMPASSSRR